MARRRKTEVAGLGGSVVERALEDLGGACLDAGQARQAIRDTLTALQKQAETLKKLDLTEVIKCMHCKQVARYPMTAKDIAQTISYTAKMIDDTARLVEFVEGRADSRPDLGSLQSFLKVLLPDQFEQLCRWVDEGEGRTLQ